MKLSEWAKKNSVSYQTAWKQFKNGQIPGAYQLQTGTVVVPEPRNSYQKPERTILYARVSSSQNKDNLKSQMERLRLYACAKGYQVSDEVTEIGSGLNDQRPKLIKILKDPDITRIIVEHKDRLTRFGFNYIQTLLETQGVEVEVINLKDNQEHEIVEDLVSIITSFCARIYGKRRTQRKTQRILSELNKDD